MIRSDSKKIVARIFLQDKIIISPFALDVLCESRSPFYDAIKILFFMKKRAYGVLDLNTIWLWLKSEETENAYRVFD